MTFLIQIMNLMLIYQIFLKKDFFPYDYWHSVKIFKEKLLTKNKFNNTLTNQAIVDKSDGHILTRLESFKMNIRSCSLFVYSWL